MGRENMVTAPGFSRRRLGSRLNLQFFYTQEPRLPVESRGQTPTAGGAHPGPKETNMGKGDHRQRKEVKKPKKDKAAKGKK
jgi:hypothetical protein